jgi:hypothetical protein
MTEVEGAGHDHRQTVLACCGNDFLKDTKGTDESI